MSSFFNYIPANTISKNMQLRFWQSRRYRIGNKGSFQSIITGRSNRI